MIKKCTCKHKDQDKRYGENNRVHNRISGGRGLPGYRCTVCGKEK